MLKQSDRVTEIFNGRAGSVQAVSVVAGMVTYYVLLDGDSRTEAFYDDEISREVR